MVTETILRWVVEYGYIGIFSVLALGIIGTPIPDEGVLAFAGYLIYEGKLSFVPTMTAAFLGSACGITLSYGLGRAFGNYLIAKLGRAVEITGDRETHIQNWYDRVGKWGLLFGYYLPGVRHLIALGAGIARLRAPIFALFAFAGAFIWSTTFVCAGYFLGREWTLIFGKVRPSLVASSVVIASLVLLYLLVQHFLGKQKT